MVGLTTAVICEFKRSPKYISWLFYVPVHWSQKIPRNSNNCIYLYCNYTSPQPQPKLVGRFREICVCLVTCVHFTMQPISTLYLNLYLMCHEKEADPETLIMFWVLVSFVFLCISVWFNNCINIGFMFRYYIFLDLGFFSMIYSPN